MNMVYLARVIVLLARCASQVSQTPTPNHQTPSRPPTRSAGDSEIPNADATQVLRMTLGAYMLPVQDPSACEKATYHF